MFVFFFFFYFTQPNQTTVKYLPEGVHSAGRRIGLDRSRLRDPFFRKTFARGMYARFI